MDMDTIKRKVLEDVDPELRRKKIREMRKQRGIVALQFTAIVLLILIIFHIIMGISTVSGQSMYPTLHDGDIIIYKRYNTEYKQGDIVAIKRPDGEEYIKRIIAVAGDTVNIQGGNVYVNGRKIELQQTLGSTEIKSDDITYPLVVGDKEVFVLGDNREVSKDSREIGTVSLDDIKGKIIWYIGKP